MATLLSIVQDVAKLGGFAVPNVAFGSAEETPRLLVACASRAAMSLMKRHHWDVITKEATITTSSGQETYDLPSDYDRTVGDTAWDRANYERLTGPLSPVDWQVLKSSQITIGTDRRFRFKVTALVTKIYVDPIPTVNGNILVYEYVSREWAKTAAGTAINAWTADTNILLLDDNLLTLGTLWRFLNRLGLQYVEEKDEYERELSQAIARDRGGGVNTLSIVPGHSSRFLSPSNIPDGNFPTN